MINFFPINEFPLVNLSRGFYFISIIREENWWTCLDCAKIICPIVLSHRAMKFGLILVCNFLIFSSFYFIYFNSSLHLSLNIFSTAVSAWCCELPSSRSFHYLEFLNCLFVDVRSPHLEVIFLQLVVPNCLHVNHMS